MNQEPKQCLHCQHPATTSHFCARCGGLTDMIQSFLCFCGNPNFLERNVQTISHCNTIDDIRSLGMQRNAPQLVGLAYKLDEHQRRAGRDNLVPVMVKSLQGRVVGQKKKLAQMGV